MSLFLLPQTIRRVCFHYFSFVAQGAGSRSVNVAHRVALTLNNSLTFKEAVALYLVITQFVLAFVGTL